MKRLMLALLVAVSFGAQAQFGGIDFGKALDIGKKALDQTTQQKEFSQEDEIQLGDGIAATLLGASPLSKDANLQRYVNRVGRWVALHSERPDLPWTFGVIETQTVNAFAMPGADDSGRHTPAPSR